MKVLRCVVHRNGIKFMKNQDWTRDEHILALTFYLRHAPSIPGKNSVEVIQLSDLLKRM